MTYRTTVYAEYQTLPIMYPTPTIKIFDPFKILHVIKLGYLCHADMFLVLEI